MGGIVWVLGVRLPSVEDVYPYRPVGSIEITLCRRPIYPYRPVGSLGVRLPCVEDLSFPYRPVGGIVWVLGVRLP